MKKSRTLALLVMAGTLCVSGWCQQITSADYARVDTVLNRVTRVYSPAVVPIWISGTHDFWYQNHERQGDIYYLVNAETGRKQKAFDQDKLAAALTKETGKTVKSSGLTLESANFDNANVFAFTYNNQRWRYDIRRNTLSRSENEQSTLQRPMRRGYGHRDTAKIASPDRKWEAYIRDHNVYIRQAGQSKEIRLSHDGTPNLFYSSAIIWSPDSKKIATVRIRDVETRQIPLIESAPSTQVQPIVHWRNYAKPGDVLAIHLPALFNVEAQKQIPLKVDLYAHQYTLQLTGWRKDSRGFIFEFNQRGHERFIVGEVNGETGAIHHIADEQPGTFFYYNSRYRYDLSDGSGMLWISERDGWRHIYQMDGRNGNARQITKGEWVVRQVDYVDEPNKVIYFYASGFNKGEDPYNMHMCRINFDGTGFKDLTPENGTHTTYFSQDRRYFVDVYSRPDVPPISQVKRTADATQIAELERCDISAIVAEGYVLPEVFHAKGRDGKTDIWGNIHRPSNYDPKRNYPVIELIYAGPHGSFVEKYFAATHRQITQLCEVGFIVVQIDGMGTFNRSKAFHNVSWRNLKDAGYPDRILWIKAMVAKYPNMDISNLGVFGRSAGGQNSMAALLFHNDFYKVAVSFCGCHDNRMDKIWWNEQWMGYPIDEAYSASSNVDNAHLLEGKLLLVNGELDDNVDPTSTLQVVRALMDANKNFDQLYLPGEGHPLTNMWIFRRMHDHFVRHLYKQEPPTWWK